MNVVIAYLIFCVILIAIIVVNTRITEIHFSVQINN